MSTRRENLSIFNRAWTDTIKSFHKIYFFWLVEVIAAGLGGFVGTIITPDDAGRITSAAYPVVGIFFGILAGFLIIFVLNLFLAPYRLFKEAIKQLNQIDTTQSKIKDEIDFRIIEGTDILQQFKSVTSHSSYMPVKEFNNWRDKTLEVLDQSRDSSLSTLFFRDVYLDDGRALLLKDYIQACESGLDRLEEFIKSL